MKKSIQAFLIIFSSALIIGCAGQPVMNEVPGGIYAGYKMGKDAEGAIGKRVGKSCASSVLGLVAFGDASIRTAAANGGITKVTIVDKEAIQILNLYATYCTVVYGE
ncbi:MAG: TRL-like family protein [Nitrosomonas sp.]|nr:TRL-like family protein [Nitrosomonas sp.]